MAANTGEPELAEVPVWLQGVRGTQVQPLINPDASAIRVEAGPGTGKTFGLVRRVQRLLHPTGGGVQGERILVVAFNRVIAKALQKDVDEQLGNSPHDGEPVIRTVHALCLQIIGSDLRLLLPHEREAMLYDVGRYAFDWGDRVRTRGGRGRLGQLTPPACRSTRSR